MLIELQQIVPPGKPSGPPTMRVTVVDGNFETHGSIIEQLPPKTPNVSSRIDFFLDAQVPDGATKADVVRMLRDERSEFNAWLSEPEGITETSGHGRYEAETLVVRVDYQAYRDRGAGYYLNAYDTCVEYLDRTPLQSLP